MADFDMKSAVECSITLRPLTVEMTQEDGGYRLGVTQASSRLLGQNLLGL